MSGAKLMKKAMVLFTGLSLILGALPAVPVNAAQEIYTCVLFAEGTGESISVKAGNINMNGDIVTNGKFVTTLQNPGLNGTVYENQENAMIDYRGSIEKLYYSGNVNKVDEDYSPKDFNENISTPMSVEGAFTSTGNNVAINSAALMTTGDITIDGGSFSCSDAVIYSKEGNIRIATDNFSASALIYAPEGTVYIECGGVNMNGCVVAQSIEIVSNGGVNLNKNESLIKKFGEAVTANEALNDKDADYYKAPAFGENVNPTQTQEPGTVGQESTEGADEKAPKAESTPKAENTSAEQESVSQSGEQEVIPASSEAAGVPEYICFENISQVEMKYPLDLLILLYQIWTGQKHVIIY